MPATEQMQSIEAPPLYDYSYDGMLNLEQRIKLELHSVGLLREDELEVKKKKKILRNINKLKTNTTL